MVIEGGWLIPYLASTYPGFQYGIAPLPTLKSLAKAPYFARIIACYPIEGISVVIKNGKGTSPLDITE